MPVKPTAKICEIMEQIIEDPVTGLIFQFELKPGSDAPIRLHIYGDLPYGNREVLFDKDGIEAGAGTSLRGSCKPSWVKEVIL